MSRVGWLLVVLLSLLLGIGWYFLSFDPTAEDIADVRAQTEQVRTQTTQQLARAEELREVRQNAPESEAALAAGQLLIPEEPAIPALFRQMQRAADDSGVRLTSITPSAPSAVAVADGGTQVSAISVSMSVTGTYFQIVDLARRIEDPLLIPRALLWRSVTMSPSDFPELTISITGEVYSRGPDELPMVEADAPPPESESDEEPDGDVESDPELDEDLDVEVES